MPATEVTVARPPAGRPNAGEPDEPDEPDESASFDEESLDDENLDDEGDVADEPGDESARTSTADRFWKRVRVDPVEIALPAGVGYTLRAYRQNTDITPADVSARQDDVPMPRRQTSTLGLDQDETDADNFAEEFDQYEDEFGEESDEAESEEDDSADGDDEADEDEVVEEVPLFLSHGGHLLLFRSTESLVDFVLSDAEHDLQQIDTWEPLTRNIQSEYVVATTDDTYELDLVVRNLRGGHDVWDAELLVRAGQLARDLGHALRIEPVMLALAPNAPLDDLDEALRAVADGGVGSFFARRRLKKIGAETASLGWRTVIGKISAVVDWRD
jgi:hypothetical protein